MVQALQPITNQRRLKDAVVIQRTSRERFYSPLRPPRALYVLLDGRVTVARLTREGKRFVMDVLQPGDVFGDLSFSGAGNDSEIAEALTDCRALVVDSRRARALIASEPELAIYLLTAVANRLDATCERLEEFAYRPVDTRIASAVLRVAGHAGEAAPVTHQFLAEMAGTYRETATRVLGELHAKDILRLARCTIEIKDPQALAEKAAV